jgi:ABC-type ATPase involved in cell division
VGASTTPACTSAATQPAAGLLSFEAVVKRHRDGRRLAAVLDGVSFELAPGEFVGLRGPRRSGKTTLLRIAAGIDRPDAGSVRCLGTDLATMPARERARWLRAVGFAPQAWRAARGKPVIDHVALPLLVDGCSLRAAMIRAHEAIERVGAAEHADAAPHELPPDAMTRVSLARASVRRPRLLVVDDPGPPAAGERAPISDLLHELAGDGMGVLVAGRDVASLHGAHRIMSIGNGSLRVHEPPAATVVPFPRPTTERGA